MSDEPLVPANPFTLTVPDEETELRALARALSFAEGFALLFARCNQPVQRQRLVAALRKELPQLAIQEIHFSGPIEHLLDELRWRLAEPPPGAVFVSGLEYSLPIAAEAHATPLVANLNASRNSFSRVVPCPLVLWVPEYVLTAIMRGAPDFFSVRSGVYFFIATPTTTGDLIDSLVSGDEWTIATLTLAEKQERVVSIKSLLADYQALPSSQRDRPAEMRLLTRLGNLYFVLGRGAEAETCHQQTLAICRELGDRAAEARTLNNLGNIYQSQGRWAEAESAYRQSLCQETGDRVSKGISLMGLGNVYSQQKHWAEAESLYQQSLSIYREVGDQINAGIALNNLGNVYRLQGRWAEAEAVYQQGLAIYREVGDRLHEGHTLNNLGVVYRQQGQWTEAEAAFQQSLDIAQTVSSPADRGIIYNNLANVYIQQGRWAEAQRAIQQSLEIAQQLGDRTGEGRSLHNLALLWWTQGDVQKAVEYGQRAVALLETTQDEIAKEKVREFVAQLERSKSSPSEQPAE